MSLQKAVERMLVVLEKTTGKSRDELGFAPGASEKELNALESELPKLPKELRQLLAVVNGQDTKTPILPAARLQSAEDILAEWKDLCENVDEETFGGEYQDDDKVKLFNATKLWIPLAWDYEAGGGIYHYIDLDPGPNGKVGQVLQATSECDFQVLTGSLTAMFENIAKCFAEETLRLEPQEDGKFALFWDTEEYWELVGE
jgi:cell wall assembly regulator SMI1